MPQVSQLSPQLAQGLLQLARSLLVAARNWTLYPPEHPTVAATVERLCDAVRQSSLGSAFSIGITPDTLLVGGTPAGTSGSIAEAAAFLHDHDLLNITFLGDVSHDGITRLLRLLALDDNERRGAGGPEKIWASEGHPSLILEQVDYGKLFARQEGNIAEPAKRDNLWRSIVMAIAGGQSTVFDERSQQRLLAIAGSSTDIQDLATAVMAPKCAMDGSPMITSQAATVLAAFRHLTSIVSVMSPEQMPAVMGNLATAVAQLDPHVVVQVMQTEDDPSERVPLVKGLAGAFDDVKVAQLLATALTLEGRASDRLATIFNTIAPDEERRRRVLTLTRHLLSETDFGKSDQFQILWSSAEQLLLSYDDAPFVSETYRAALDGVGARAERMATADLPPELPEWMDSLGQDSVRTLSVTLLIDLLTVERDAARVDDIARDMGALAEDLLLSGAYGDARAVTRVLEQRAATAGASGRDACRGALDRLGESIALQETAALLGDLDEEGWQDVQSLITLIGAASIDGLKVALISEEETLGRQRAADVIVSFGRPAVSRLASLLSDERWFVQRNVAQLLGRIAAPEGVPFLQPLVRKKDPRVARAALSALAGIPDPSAARAIHTVLRAAAGELRQAVVGALVADRDPRVVPMLARIIEESQPLGKDHDVVLETLTALGMVGSNDAIPALVATIKRRGLFGRKKLRALKERGVAALARIGTAQAAAALNDAATSGDGMLKKIVSSRGKG